MNRKPECGNCPHWQYGSDRQWGYCCLDDSYHVTHHRESCGDHPDKRGMGWIDSQGVWYRGIKENEEESEYDA